MRTRLLLIGFAVASSLAACGAGASVPRANAMPTTVQVSPGPLTASDRSIALAVARQTQRTVIGTFVGATAFTLTESPPGDACTLAVRLVWSADANFSHAGMGPPDGARKALLLSVNAKTGKVCETAAIYNRVGADPGETLLYGQWPRPADG